MPEEVNRILTDQLADLLLTPSADGDANLLREGIAPERIVRVGNVMIDTLLQQVEQSQASHILRILELTPQSFGVVTLHRPANVDEPETLRGIVGALSDASLQRFPVNPIFHVGVPPRQNE